MNEIVELGNRLLDLFQGFGIVAVIIFAIGFVVWCVMAGFILKMIKGIFNRINESRERDPYESLFGKGYKERRNKGFEPKDIDEFLEHERQELREMNEKWKKEHAQNVARAEADEFEISLIRSQLAKAEISGRCYHSQGMSEEDCDQAIINGIRRMGFTKEKIKLAGYNPDIADKGFYGTGGHKNE